MDGYAFIRNTVLVFMISARNCHSLPYQLKIKDFSVAQTVIWRWHFIAAIKNGFASYLIPTPVKSTFTHYEFLKNNSYVREMQHEE